MAKIKKPIKGGVESTEDTAEAFISELGNWAEKSLTNLQQVKEINRKFWNWEDISKMEKCK